MESVCLVESDVGGCGHHLQGGEESDVAFLNASWSCRANSKFPCVLFVHTIGCPALPATNLFVLFVWALLISPLLTVRGIKRRASYESICR